MMWPTNSIHLAWLAGLQALAAMKSEGVMQ